MLNVSIKKLVEAIEEAEGFKMPEMNMGTEYLYQNVYNKMATGFDVHISDLDFNSFDLEDLEHLQNVCRDIFEDRECKSRSISDTLKIQPPVSSLAVYV